MTRWANSPNATAAAATTLTGAILADLHFDSGTLYLHDGFGTLTANSQTYSGLGEFGGVDVASEDLSNIANPVTLMLTGVDPAYIADVMTEDCQGRIVTLWVGLLNASMAWYAAPEIVWEGRMDYPQIDMAQNSATLKMTCEHRLMREPLVARYTDQDQQLAHPGDRFFDLQWMIALATASWGHVDVFHPVNQAPTQSPKPGSGKSGGYPGTAGGGGSGYTYGSGWT